MDFHDLLEEPFQQVAPGLKGHMISNNLSTHQTPGRSSQLPEHPTVHPHDQVEQWFARCCAGIAASANCTVTSGNTGRMGMDAR
ncbi:hypothetical protein ACU635_08575 [[Actinomadura] parvosata]|uniref:hypothetical protein n=1 Tax=[Actinomadura] parvosata TaxID=1955412 RepID=UPI00406C0205